MIISIVISTYNREKSVIKTLQALHDQKLPLEDFEVIIVDDASSDDTERIVCDYIAQHSLSKWQYLRHAENLGSAGAMNIGIRAARAPLVAFIDDDIVPHQTWAAAHLKRHRRETRSVVVVGKVSYPDDWIAKSNLVRYHNSRYIGYSKYTGPALAGTPLRATHLAGGNFSVLRAILIDIGMNDERLRRGQDCDLGIRLQDRGLSIVYEPEAEVIHFAKQALSYKKWFSAFQRFYIESAPEIIQKHHNIYYKQFHWFVERPELFREALKYSIAKLFIRLVAWPGMGKRITRTLEKHDSNPIFYLPLVFKYVLLCAAIEGVNMRDRTPPMKTFGRT